jgi:hypothetical protein
MRLKIIYAITNVLGTFYQVFVNKRGAHTELILVHPFLLRSLAQPSATTITTTQQQHHQRLPQRRMTSHATENHLCNHKWYSLYFTSIREQTWAHTELILVHPFLLRSLAQPSACFAALIKKSVATFVLLVSRTSIMFPQLRYRPFWN